MMAVYDRAAKLCADLIELVAEVCHLISAVLIAGDDLINWVDDDSDVVFLGSPSD